MTISDRSGHGRAAREREYRRVIWVSLFLSVLVHVAFLWTTNVRVRSSPYVLPPIETTPAPEGLIVVDVALVELEEGLEDPRPEPSETSPQTRRSETEVIAIAEAEIPGAPGDPDVGRPGERAAPPADPGPSNAQRLTPRFVDGRIWFDPRDPLLFGDRLAKFARADSAVRAILAEWLDSLRLTDEQARRATDWTFEKDGKRWGISPEGLHLGDITIPIPFGFAPSGPRRREFEQAIRDLQEIQLQNLRMDLDEVADERREAMRERSEEEVRRRAGDTISVRRPPARAPP